MKRWLPISRPCYDKFHRCPGWAGGGMRYAKVMLCDGGSMAGYGGVYYKANEDERGKHWRLWRVNRCPKCRVLVLPYMIRWLDPGWWKCELQGIPGKISDWRWERSYRRGQ